MAAASIINTVNQTNLEKVESFLNDPLYKESIESSLNYNTRLCLERRLRLPFIDTQTGVAQNHSALFMHKRQRIPGLFPGQIYSYPRQRWRKKRRQYLYMNSRTFARGVDGMLADPDGDMHNISQIENPALQDTDSKDSQLLLKDDVSKQEWFYDDQDMLEMDTYDEPDQDSDLDYEETYSKRSKRKKTPARGRNESPGTPGRKKGSGRGRKKAAHSFEPTPGDPDKPFACELCGARYKTRPGLTYHYSHSHKEGASDCENSRDSNAAGGVGAPQPPSTSAPQLPIGVGEDMMGGSHSSQSAIPGHVYQDSYVSFLNQTPGTPGRRGRPNNPPQPAATSAAPPAPPVLANSLAVQQPSNIAPNSNPPTLPPICPPMPPTAPVDDPPMPVLLPEKIDPPPQMGGAAPVPTTSEREKGAAPSPYCDFCLGDSRENKKTGTMEELVSCSDCGRSGHPSCLLFTDNMKISVKKYSWQCIECKCCSVCGTSDNDDKLLFCDDCDRGYHMYCLSPPLSEPPEGSWSCKLCIEQFHKC